MFNKVEQVKHLPIGFGDIARYVIVPGDPNRVPIISELLDDVEHQGRNREPRRFTRGRGIARKNDDWSQKKSIKS